MTSTASRFHEASLFEPPPHASAQALGGDRSAMAGAPQDWGTGGASATSAFAAQASAPGGPGGPVLAVPPQMDGGIGMPGTSQLGLYGDGRKRAADWLASPQEELPRLISEIHISPAKRQKMLEAQDMPLDAFQAASSASDFGRPGPHTASQPSTSYHSEASYLPNQSGHAFFGAPGPSAAAPSPPPSPAFSGQPGHQLAVDSSQLAMDPSQLAIIPVSTPVSQSAPPSASLGPASPGRPWPALVEDGSLTQWGRKLMSGNSGAGDIGGASLQGLSRGKPIQIKGGKSLTEALDLVGAPGCHVLRASLPRGVQPPGQTWGQPGDAVGGPQEHEEEEEEGEEVAMEDVGQSGPGGGLGTQNDMDMGMG